MILEGDWTNKPIPQYFEGMKSVGQDDVNGHKIEILSRNDKLIINKDKLLNEGIFYPTKGWSAIRLVTKAKKVKIVVTNKDGLARQTKLSVKNDIESEVRLTRLFERNESFNKVEIDYELLDTLPSGVMVELNTTTLQSKIKFEPIQNQLKETTITRLKGSIDTSDSNYNDIKECGFTCEIIQTEGETLTDFWLRKVNSKWYIMKDQNGNGVIEFKPIEGIQELENVSWISETLKAKVNILNPSVLNEWSDTTIKYIHIVNSTVNEFSKPIKIEDFLIKQSLGLI